MTARAPMLLARAGPLLALLVLLACDRRAPSRDPEGMERDPEPSRGVASSRSATTGPHRDDTTAPPALLAEIERLKAEAGMISDDPPARAGDLKRDIDDFQNLDACVAAHASRDPLVGDALDALGYTTLARDACRTIEAIKTRDPERCAPIAASALRDKCRAAVAVYAENAEMCPRSVDLGAIKGRDPVCLARAAHDERLCVTARGAERDRCRALVLGDGSLCNREPTCGREVERWKSLVGSPQKQSHPLAATRLHVQLHGSGGTPDPKTTSFDVDDEARAGALVRARDKTTEIVIGAPRTVAWSRWDAPFASPRAFIVVTVPSELEPAEPKPSVPKSAEPKADLAAELELVLPGAATISSAALGEIGQVKVERRKLATKIGEPIELVLTAAVHQATQTFTLRCEIATFVRETVR